MLHIEIPQRALLELHHAVFDINGTLAVDGKPIPNVVGHLKSLAAFLSIHLLTAGTHGNLKELEETLGFPLQIISNGDQKASYVQQLGQANVIAFGNCAHDAGMLSLAAIGVAVLVADGIAISAFEAAGVRGIDSLDAIYL